jgi:hypothetical protein
MHVTGVLDEQEHQKVERILKAKETAMAAGGGRRAHEKQAKLLRKEFEKGI